ncbi:unnamed protein product [Rotaria socialis]|uniref:Proactivator polypeptide n=2 Tax=Rotaria socialis TaxID=392032 RepID=A0A817WGB8_9BILA|nr:unnamed protein product [Rotaria socialis]CAF4518770.1 unnamed protein product [Rotaria socialis]
MAKALFVTYLIALSIGSTASYSTECTVGPEYWCKSFENAEDCGSIQHCTDTVWIHDSKYTSVDESSTCQWCQRMFQNTQKGLEEVSSNEDMIASTLKDECKSLFPTDVSSKCTNVIEKYRQSAVTLLKNNRFATLCRLMSICTSGSTTEKSPIIVGQHQCTWGPSFWCSSLSNTRQCNSIDHCSKQVWSQQAIQHKENDNICQYCEYVITKLRSILAENKTEIDLEKWLSGACSMLASKDKIDECIKTMSQYGKEILVLVENNIDAGVICHLGQMCKDATIVQREETVETHPDEEHIDNGEIKQAPFDEQSKILCNVVVRATHDLHVNQQKSQSEIQTFLKNDCQKLTTSELKQKCENLIDRHGNDIYGHVTNNRELSNVCENIDFLDDELSSPVHCEVCTFVLTNVKYMLDDQHSDDEILHYIDQHLCSNWNGEIKQNCKFVIENIGENLIEKMKNGTKSLLLCNYFQVCHNEIRDKTSPIQKNEMRAFLSENICDQLGPYEATCYALMENDATNVLKTLVNNFDGDILCQMFGICQMKMSLKDNLSINDDKNACKRCVDDFTRRKHIAEKLLNHSSEFLHHLCGQLPQKDECTAAVDESINKLVAFIQSLNPQEICVELKMCTEVLLENLDPMRITTSDSMMSHEIIVYIKNEICAKFGPLSKLCYNLVDSEGANLFSNIAKGVDPHRVCDVLNVCPTTKAFENCNDKCECCVAKIENYQVELAAFLQTMLSTTNFLCEQIPNSESCRNVATEFKSNIDQIINHFNAKRICQVLTHCSAAAVDCNTENDRCGCCQNNLNFRQNNFRTVANEITTTLVSLCQATGCHSSIKLNHQQIIDKLDRTKSFIFCQRFGLCTVTKSFRSMSTSPNSMAGIHVDLGSSIEAFLDSFCSEFGDFKSICEQLIASKQYDCYAKVYLALLNNNQKLIDADLHELKADTCDQCKIMVQSSKDFWLNGLESARNALLQTCESCPVKDQCRELFNQQFDNLKSYVDGINPEQFCQNIHLCSVSSVGKCSTCVERLQLRKDAISQASDRLTGHFRDLCQQNADKQCQLYVQQVHDLVQLSLEEFDLTETCTAMGFCTTENSEKDLGFDQYEKNVENEIVKNICSTLGPFETLCKSIIHGDTKQIQELKINYDIKDLVQIEKQLTDNLSNTEDLDEPTQDKCKHCLFRVTRRKRHTKFVGDKMFFSLIRSCQFCPAKHLCRRHWRMRQARFDAHIDRINPKRVCIHFGFCNKSSLCDNVGSSQAECDESIESNKSEIEEIKKVDDSNATCVLCEYVMHSLTNYINSQSTQKEIEENLEKVCSLIPSTLRNQCYDYIDNYGPPIIAILLQEFDLATVCHKLNLCTNQMKIDITHILKADTATCGICDYISTFLNFALKRSSQEKSLQHSLSTVCSHLSEEQQSKCQTIVHLFSPHIEQLKLSPGDNFCQELPLCQTPMSELQPAIPLKKDVEKEPMINQKLSETPQCTLCHYVISYLDAVLKNNKSEQAVEEALKKVCTILPSKERTRCEEFVNSYGPVLAQLIAEMADPNTICSYLGVCQNSIAKQSTTKPITSVTTSSPVKYGKCIFGMNYWCASRANAELCNAVELCELHVWSKKHILIT